MAGPRAYKQNTIKILYGLSGNTCAFPGCEKRMVNTKNALDSNICHIEGANKGSERYNPNMTDEERADYNNLILLCPQHHAETNDVNKYPVKALQKIKREHESQQMGEKLAKNPSMLKNVINAISKIELTPNNENSVFNEFDINEKLTFNELKANAELIKEYRVYHSKLNSLYDTLTSQGSIKKEMLLENIKLSYLLVKGRFIGDSKDSLTVIKDNSDKIFDEVYDLLFDKLIGSNLIDEEICFGLRIVLVDAFMRCKILEEPQVLTISQNIDHNGDDK